MGRLVFVSNRVERVIKNQPTSGGLVAAVFQTLQRTGGLWFGWNGEIAEPHDIPETGSNRNAPSVRSVVEADDRINYATLPLSPPEDDLYHYGFADRALRFAGKLAAFLRLNGILWAHDYFQFSFARALLKQDVAQPIELLRWPTERQQRSREAIADLRLNDVPNSTDGFRRALAAAVAVPMGSVA